MEEHGGDARYKDRDNQTAIHLALSLQDVAEIDQMQVRACLDFLLSFEKYQSTFDEALKERGEARKIR